MARYKHFCYLISIHPSQSQNNNANKQSQLLSNEILHQEQELEATEHMLNSKYQTPRKERSDNRHEDGASERRGVDGPPSRKGDSHDIEDGAGVVFQPLGCSYLYFQIIGPTISSYEKSCERGKKRIVSAKRRNTTAAGQID